MGRVNIFTVITKTYYPQLHQNWEEGNIEQGPWSPIG